jgi:Sec-independent protein secretion pathway component TatC
MNPTDGTQAGDTSAEDAAVAAHRRQVVDGGIMSFGDHLDELRRCSISALVGLVIATVFSLIFAERILAFILKPALVVLDARGQRAELQALGPPDTFIMYLKMALLCGIILAMPWILHQIWRFVSVGLYSHEKRFVRAIGPASIGLFIAGVLFMFFLVLPVVLNFLVGFTENIRIDELRPGFLQAWVVGQSEDGDRVDALKLNMPHVPVVHGEPENVTTGGLWFDEQRNRLCVRGKDQVYALPFQPAQDVQAVRSHFSLSEYVGFVLALSLGFGLAFELPMVVLFITAMGLVTVDKLAQSRRYVIFGIFIAAAFLTPPDVISQVLLAIPMVILFEGALFAARHFVEKKQSEPRP